MLFPLRKLFYRFCLVIPLFFLIAVVQAQASVTIDGLVYTLNEDLTATLNGYAETCPNSVSVSNITSNSITYAVTEVSYGAFSGCSNLTTVSLPEVITINGYAFAYVPNLVSASFAKAITIDEDAFAGCTSLTTIYFPQTTTIGYSTFSDCSSLTTASFPEATSLNVFSFLDCTLLVNIDFPKITTIGYGAFSGCSSLTTASFPEATSIGEYAFEDCSALTTIDFPKLTNINNYAFFYCTSLITINFPKAITIANSAFGGCSALTSVSFPEVTSIGSAAFANSISLTTINFPKAITITDDAFYGCSALTSVSFPEVISIGEHAFENCSALTSVSFSNVENINNYAFSGCSSLATVSFPEVTSIGTNAFLNDISLTTLNFPKATTIADSAFKSCSSLTTVSFPEVTSIGDYGFASCSNLASASLPKITIINKDAFSSTSLNSLILGHLPTSNSYYIIRGYLGTLPQIIYTEYSEEYQNSNLFFGWNIVNSSTEELTISNNIFYVINNINSTARLIGHNSSESCPTTIEGSINFNNKIYNAVNISAYAFLNCSELTSINLPQVTEIGAASFANCINLNSVYLPELTTMGDDAFAGNASLTAINLPKITEISDSAFNSEYSGSSGGGISSALPQPSFFASLRNFFHLNVFASTVYDSTCGLISANFPEVLAVGDNAFSGCQQLNSISLPKATVIGRATFSNCTNLITVELPKVISIGYNAFVNTNSLTTISFPELIEVEAGAFSTYGRSACALTTVNLPKVKTIGNWAFQDCSSLTEISLPELVSVGEEAFAPYSETCSLTKASFPKLDTIGNLAFANCNNFSSLTLGHLPTSVAGDAFSGYTSESPRNLYTNFTSEYTGTDWNGWIVNDLPRTTSANLTYALDPNSQTAILSGYDTDIGCPTTIDSSSVNYNGQTYDITSVNDKAFSNCPNITTVNLPKVTNVGSYAFSPEVENVAYFSPQAISHQLSRIFKPQVAADSLGDVCSITSLNLPEALIINEGAFKDCSLLTSINLPQATTIGVEAFAGGTSLTTASLPQLTVLGDRAFNNCSTFNSLTLGHLPTTVGSDVFAGYTNSAPRNLYTLYASEYPSDNWYGWIINQLSESEDNQTSNQATSVQSFSTNYSSPEPASAPSCGATIPSGTPKIFQIQRRGEAAILYLEPGDSSFRGQYHLIFGFKQGDQRFGALSAQVIDGSGAEKMVVNNLSPKANYWFTVAPVNGCAVGNWSNWAQSKATQKVWHLFNK